MKIDDRMLSQIVHFRKQGFGCSRIAAILNLTESTVRMRLKRHPEIAEAHSLTLPARGRPASSSDPNEASAVHHASVKELDQIKLITDDAVKRADAERVHRGSPPILPAWLEEDIVREIKTAILNFEAPATRSIVRAHIRLVRMYTILFFRRLSL